MIGKGALSASCIRSGPAHVTRFARWLAARPEWNEAWSEMRKSRDESALLTMCRDVLTVWDWTDETDDLPGVPEVGPHIVIVGIPKGDE